MNNLARVLVSESIKIAYDEVMDIQITEIPPSDLRPHGVKYSLNYRVMNSRGDWISVIRYDNAHIVKGHKKADHRHILDREIEEIEFISLEKIYKEILKLVTVLRGEIDDIKKL